MNELTKTMNGEDLKIAIVTAEFNDLLPADFFAVHITLY